MPAVEESCIYTITPDRKPVIDTLPGVPNIAIGAGFSGDLLSCYCDSYYELQLYNGT